LKCSTTSDGKCRCPGVKKAIGNLVEFNITIRPGYKIYLKGYAVECKTMWSQRTGGFCQICILENDGSNHYANFITQTTAPSTPIKHFSTEETIIFKLEHGL